MDTVVSFVSQNLILTLIVLFLLFKGITSGGFSGLIRWGVLIVLVVFAVKACEQWVSQGLQEASEEVNETVLSGACRLIRISPVCDGVAVYQGAVESEAKRRACYDKVINDPAVYYIGGADVATQCEALRQDYPAWQSCVEAGFERSNALRGRLLPCQPYGPESIFDQFKNYSRPFACIFGIDSWCEVSAESEPPRDNPLDEFERYAQHQSYLTCMHQFGLDYGLETDTCYAILTTDPTANAPWALCVSRVAEKQLEPHISGRELARCRNQVP